MVEYSSHRIPFMEYLGYHFNHFKIIYHTFTITKMNYRITYISTHVYFNLWIKREIFLFTKFTFLEWFIRQSAKIRRLSWNAIMVQLHWIELTIFWVQLYLMSLGYSHVSIFIYNCLFTKLIKLQKSTDNIDLSHARRRHTHVYTHSDFFYIQYIFHFLRKKVKIYIELKKNHNLTLFNPN